MARRRRLSAAARAALKRRAEMTDELAATAVRLGLELRLPISEVREALLENRTVAELRELHDRKTWRVRRPLLASFMAVHQRPGADP